MSYKKLRPMLPFYVFGRGKQNNYPLLKPATWLHCMQNLALKIKLKPKPVGKSI